MQDKKEITKEKKQIELTEFKVDGKVFIEKECLKNLAEHIHGKENVFLVEGNPYFTGSTHRRLDWINNELLVKVFKGYGSLENLSHPLHFIYVKFAKSKENVKKIFGIQSGKSQIHSSYKSDITFWKIKDEPSNDRTIKEKHLEEFMRKNKLEWYENEVLIIKTLDYYVDYPDNYNLAKELAEKEARYIERNISWGLFD